MIQLRIEKAGARRTCHRCHGGIPKGHTHAAYDVLQGTRNRGIRLCRQNLCRCCAVIVIDENQKELQKMIDALNSQPAAGPIPPRSPAIYNRSTHAQVERKEKRAQSRVQTIYSSVSKPEPIYSSVSKPEPIYSSVSKPEPDDSKF